MQDTEQTKLLRMARVEEKRSIKDLNNIGKRLLWTREKLGLSRGEVCSATGIPMSSYFGRELGIRPELAEEFLVISTFFNTFWQKKYGDSYPLYEGEELKRISCNWIQFGHDDVEKNAELIIQDYQIRLKEMEQDFWNKEQELLKQLDLMSFIAQEVS